MSLLLGLDLGTSYFKVALFELTGALRGLGRVAVEKVSPAPDRFELSPALFWHYLRRALTDALAQANASADQIIAISYSSQASTFVLLDKYDSPLTPIILWTDRRGESVTDEVLAFSQTESFRQTIGFGGVSGQNAACKWLWFQRHEPEIWRRTRRVMTLSDYFTFSLTGERAGDAGTAAFLGIYNLRSHEWWPEALAAFGLDPALLSAPLCPGSPCGTTVPRATQLLGIPAGIPFAVGSLDHHVGAMGAGLGAFADVSISTGTVLAALAVVDELRPQPQCYYGLHVDGRRYYCLAFDSNGAGQLETYQKQSAPDHSIAQLLLLAERARGGADDDAHGLPTLQLMESISWTLRRLVKEVAGPTPLRRIVATGGGSRSPLWLQIKADILNVPVVTSSAPEQGCLGAAVFAAAAARIYGSIDAALSAMVRPGECFEPNAVQVARYRS
jgi:xylulokinase